MSSKLSKVRLKGNESFNFREGWLRKGVRCVEQYPDLFSRDDVMERLGVGSKMVKSIKYWLMASGLCEEKIEKNVHKLYLTDSFGKIINEYDKYFDDISTLFFANLFFGYKGLKVNKDSLQIKDIEHIQNLGLDKKALNVDYKLFVNNDFSFFTPEVRNIVADLARKSRKHFQITDDNIETYSNVQAETALVRRAVRRFYLIYGVDTDDYLIKS